MNDHLISSPPSSSSLPLSIWLKSTSIDVQQSLISFKIILILQEPLFWNPVDIISQITVINRTGDYLKILNNSRNSITSASLESLIPTDPRNTLMEPFSSCISLQVPAGPSLPLEAPSTLNSKKAIV